MRRTATLAAITFYADKEAEILYYIRSMGEWSGQPLAGEVRPGCTVASCIQGEKELRTENEERIRSHFVRPSASGVPIYRAGLDDVLVYAA